MTQAAPALPMRQEDLLVELLVLEAKLVIDAIKATLLVVLAVVAAFAGRRSFYALVARAERFGAELDVFGVGRRLPIPSSLPGAVGLPRLPALTRRCVARDAAILVAKSVVDIAKALIWVVLAPLSVLVTPLEKERGHAFFCTVLLGQTVEGLVDLYG